MLNIGRFRLSYLICSLIIFIHLPLLVSAQSENKADSTAKLASNAVDINEAVSFLRQYIQLESVSGNEIEAGLFLEEYIKQSGLHLKVFTRRKDQFNIAASLFPLQRGKPNIILQSHIDVVPIESLDKWSHDPFSAKVVGQHIYGRGALDAKGLGAMQLFALQAFRKENKAKDLPYNVTVLFVSGEETGGENGAKILMEQYADLLNPAVVLGEGGAGYQNVLYNNPDKIVFGVSIAEKQSLWLRLRIETDAGGHGAAPTNDYANLQLIRSLSRLDKRKMKLVFNRSTRRMFRKLGRAEGGIRGFFIRHINWSILAPFVKKQIESEPFLSTLLTNTITLTNIYNPPGPPNQISNTATAILDCRLVPGTSTKSFIRYIERKLDNEDIKISIISKSPDAKPSKLTNFYDAIEKSIELHYPEAVTIPFLFPATSDNSLFRSYDIPAYGFIPSVISEKDINSIHSNNERISLNTYISGINIYYDFLREAQKEDSFQLFSRKNDLSRQ